MTPDRVRVASYNIRKSRGLDGRRDPGRILDVMNALEADVIAVQEADRRLGDRPAALARQQVETNTDFSVVEVARSPVSLGWHGNAVLVRKGAEIRRVDLIDLPGLEPRGAVKVEIGLNGAALTVVGVHLGLLRSYRRAQAERIRATLAQDKEGAGRTVILGDFNEWSPRRGLEPLARDYEMVSPGRTFHSARPVAALDRLALGRDVALLDAGVAETGKAKVASDHLPIWGDVRLAPDAPARAALAEPASADR
ncbi:MAG: endonuclease/exonuclease/phosphatase family protein [Pseudomonadota bacterium]